MPTLKELVQSAYNGQHLVVTAPHSEWMERLEHEQLPSREAMVHVVKSLLMAYKHERSGRFSPSSMGECPRRLVFGWAGAPQQPPDIDVMEMADHGTGAHLRWQIEGLTMGYMTEAEAWVYDDDLMCGGSIDGILSDESLFELKTKAPGPYARIVNDAKVPLWENLLQVHTYFLLTGADWASVVYENRAYGSFYEFRIARDSKIEKEVIRRLNSYKAYVEEDELPRQLDLCEMRMGETFRRCAYREICHIPKTVSQAQTLQGKDSRVVPLAVALPDWAQDMLKALSLETGEQAS